MLIQAFSLLYTLLQCTLYSCTLTGCPSKFPTGICQMTPCKATLFSIMAMFQLKPECPANELQQIC